MFGSFILRKQFVVGAPKKLDFAQKISRAKKEGHGRASKTSGACNRFTTPGL